MERAEPSAIDSVDTLLSALSEALGERIVLDDSGRCGLVFSDGIEIVIEHLPEAEQLTFRSEILRPPAEDGACFRAALAMNYGRLPAGMWVALDPVSGFILLYTALPLRGPDGETVVLLVSDLVDLSQTLREELSQHSSAPAPGSPASYDVGAELGSGAIRA